MKRFIILFFILVSGISYAQNASTYFPSAPGYKWFFKSTPLDSLNQPIEAASTYRIDSFAVNGTYQGLAASIVYSKRGLININQQGNINDTSRYNFQGTNGFVYFSFGNLDTIGAIGQLGLVNFLRSLEQWYSTYRFNQTVNSTYNLFSRDTTITYNGTQYPLRVKADGKRLNDEVVSTVNGTYTAKKFVIIPNLSYLLTVPPLPPVPISIVSIPDTVWIASDVWVIKSVTPSQTVDLTALGQTGVRFTIPGDIQTLTTPPSAINPISSEVPNNFSLKQNYPNPFNPTTKISFDIPASTDVKLSVYNSLGKEVQTLVNENLKAGKYEVSFNGNNLSSGVYYYRLSAGNFNISKVMTLIK
ncbi:MAG: T9SS type A sorting domain-containing protein [Bacteroidetes bacterium]|nr:T9SS type A sorting domain-containing protein [Bacteroidota bacterium]